MPEGIVYVNESFHTGLVKEATLELIDRQQKVLDVCIDKITMLKVVLGSEAASSIVRGVINGGVIPTRIRRKWLRGEMWVGRFLTEAKVNPELSNPLPNDSEAEKIPNQQGLSTAEEFLKLSQDALDFLLKNQPPHRFDSLTWSSYAYTESRLLRRALYQGVIIQRN